MTRKTRSKGRPRASATVPPVTTDAAAVRKGISLKALVRTAETMEARPDTFVRYAAPTLPPGVVPATVAATDKLVFDSAGTCEEPARQLAMDSFGAAFDWLNQYNTLGCGMFFPGYPYLAELTQISEYRAPAETISTEMTRKWVDIISKGEGDKSDKITAIVKRMDELKVRDHFRRAALLDGEFGRAQIIFNIKNQGDEMSRQLPLTIDSTGIKKGTLESIQTMEPYWTTPYSWNASFPERADFYVPTSWYIMGRKTHASRMLMFVGREVPDLLKPAYNFGGISLSQLMQPYVNAWLRTRKSVSDITHNFSVTALATDLSKTLSDGADGSALIARAKLFTQNRDNQGLMLLDKDSEELQKHDTSLSGLDALQAQSQEHMAAPAHIPLIKLFGVVPTGLNATGEGEIQVWYDYVNAMQENLFGPNFEIMLKVVQLDLFGSIDEDISYKWVSLDEPTIKEASEIRASDATAGASYIASGVITNEEERERLQNDPTSGYDNLNGPAPEPEQIDPLTGEPMPGNENGVSTEESESGDDTDAESDGELSEFTMDESKFEESKHPRGNGGQFGSGGNKADRAETSVVVHKEYKFAGQPDDPGHENAAGKLDPEKVKAAKAGSEKVSNMMTGGKKEDKFGAVKPVEANEHSPRSTQGGASKAPFVNAFMKDHKNREDDMARLGKMPDEKLKKALELLKSNKVDDEDAKYMKDLIRDVLKAGK